MLLFFIFSTPILASQTPACDPYHCALIIDAGSSGSRAHLYHFDGDAHHPTHIKQIYLKKITPGLSSTALGDINQYMDQLMSPVPCKTIPVYFYATAGMRMLPRRDQYLILNAVHRWFDHHHEWFVQDIRVISLFICSY